MCCHCQTQKAAHLIFSACLFAPGSLWLMTCLSLCRLQGGSLIVSYKAHLLGYLEYRTPATYHAARTVLSRLDAVQTRSPRDVGVNDVSALVKFQLPLLPTRHDIAMLGLIHRTVLGNGPKQFRDLFRRDPLHPTKLVDPRKDSKSPLIKRSALGLVAVYNLLPQSVVCAKSV